MTKEVKSITKKVPSLVLENFDITKSDELFHHELLSHIMDIINQGQLVPPKYLEALLKKSIAELEKEQNVIKVAGLKDEFGATVGKVTICGDTHGQYRDFLKIFSNNVAGSPSSMSKFIFNGDIADRGPQAVEIFSVLLSMKLLAPDAIHILRGNHETKSMTSSYGFDGEVRRKYGSEMLDLFHEFFDTLPVAAVVEDQVFVVHGGLGSQTANLTIDELQEFNRFDDEDKKMMDLLWADPEENIDSFHFNYDRGGGELFGPSVTESFLTNNGLALLVRSHQMMYHGYEIKHNQRLITIFSAPNYCGTCKNKGAVLQLSRKEEEISAKIIQFEAVDKETKAERLKRKGAYKLLYFGNDDDEDDYEDDDEDDDNENNLFFLRM